MASALVQAAVSAQKDIKVFQAGQRRIGSGAHSGRQHSPIELYTPPSHSGLSRFDNWEAVPQVSICDGETSVRSLAEAQSEVSALREMLDAMLAKAPPRRAPVSTSV